MTTLHTRCSEATKQRFQALAASHGLTASLFLRKMIAAVLAGTEAGSAPLPSAEIRGGRGGSGGQIRLRLRSDEVRAIRALAEPEGYSAQAWIVRQLRHRLDGAIPFAKDELDELREVMRELGALGRNLNRMLHILRRTDRLEGSLEMEALSANIEQLRRAVTETFTRATHRGSHAEF